MKTAKLKFPKEKNENIKLCDEAYSLICNDEAENGISKYKLAGDNGSARGAFMTAFLCYINDINEQAVKYFEYAHNRGYPFACGFLLEMLNNDLSVSATIEYGKRCVCYYPEFLDIKTKKENKSKSAAEKELDEIDIEKLIIYSIKEVAATIFFLGNRALKKDFFEYAELGSKYGSYQCSLLLAKCWIEDIYVSRDISKAQRYLTIAVEQGVNYETNEIFAEIFNALKRAESEQEKIEIAKGEIRREQAYNRKMDRYSSFIGFSNWLSEFADSQSSKPPPKDTEGKIRAERTATGLEYQFYSKDDPTRAVRLKNYDPDSGKGETYDGDTVTKKV